MWKRLGLLGVIILLAAGLMAYALINGHSNTPTRSKPPKTGQQQPPSANGGHGNPSGKQGGGHPPNSSRQGGTSGSGSGSKPPSSSQGSTSGNGSSQSSPPNSSGQNNTSSGKGSPSTPPHSTKLVWGIDTADQVHSSFYQCVTTHYGKPDFIGRYLTSKKGVYSGLTTGEITFIHNNGTKILPIYNHFSNAKGKTHGIHVAKNALHQAQNLSIPKGDFIFADIELRKPVDASFLIGWTETIQNAGYKAGIYGNFVNGQVKTAYKQASSQSKLVKDHLILWTNQPSIGITSKNHAPQSFKAKSPNLNQTDLWQYGINATKCNIDTDRAKGTLLKNLW